jgi:hypothetical protein
MDSLVASAFAASPPEVEEEFFRFQTLEMLRSAILLGYRNLLVFIFILAGARAALEAQRVDRLQHASILHKGQAVPVGQSGTKMKAVIRSRLQYYTLHSTILSLEEYRYTG